MSKDEEIAFLGAGGTMGFAMARNLARAGFTVRAWNRTREKAEPLGQDGVEVTDSAAEAAHRAQVILTMLGDGEAVLAAAREAMPRQAAEDVLWLQMSTIGERSIKRCGQLARERGVVLVDAPVLGTKAPAEQGELVVLASGPEDCAQRLEPLFDAVGKRTMWVGDAGAGSRLKVATNSWIVTVVEGCAETLALAQGMGVDPQLVLDAVQGGPLDLPYLQLKGKAMIDRDFEPSFKLSLAAKDAALVEQSAVDHGLDLPLVVAIRRRLEEGVTEHGEEDLSATYLTSVPRASS